MGKYEELLCEYDDIETVETSKLPSNLSGLWLGDLILINKNKSTTEKLETLSEEIAHYRLTYGDITDTSQFNNRKFENYARRLSYEILIPIKEIIKAVNQGVHNMCELANFFEVAEGFVQQNIVHYKQKYGYSTQYGKYVVQLEPLRVFEYRNLD